MLTQGNHTTNHHPPFKIIETIIPIIPLIRFDKVTFNCSPYDDSFYGWDKYGIFINAQTKPYISKIMEEANVIQPNSYKVEDIEKVDFMEQTSYEVTIPYIIIFYISKIDNQWYITLVDEVTTDCSR